MKMETKVKEALMEELESLKDAYKKLKEEREWADNSVDEGFIVSKMEKLKTRIRAVRRQLEETQQDSDAG
jgi:hypothetical protein